MPLHGFALPFVEPPKYASDVPIAVRLLLALGLLALFVTALVGYSARNVARHEVERSHAQRIDSAAAGARYEVRWQVADLAGAIQPLCRKDDLVDRLWAELREADSGEPGKQQRAHATSQLAELARVLRVDSIVLATGEGLVLSLIHI